MLIIVRCDMWVVGLGWIVILLMSVYNRFTGSAVKAQRLSACRNSVSILSSAVYTLELKGSSSGLYYPAGDVSTSF